jgi:hypothetical protein
MPYEPFLHRFPQIGECDALKRPLDAALDAAGANER